MPLITNLEKWVLKKIIRRAVRQDSSHAKNIEDLYALVRDSALEEFQEDTVDSLQAFLRERFESTQLKFQSPILKHLPQLMNYWFPLGDHQEIQTVVLSLTLGDPSNIDKLALHKAIVLVGKGRYAPIHVMGFVTELNTRVKEG